MASPAPKLTGHWATSPGTSGNRERQGARTPGGAASPAGDAKASGDEDSEGSVTSKRLADRLGTKPRGGGAGKTGSVAEAFDPWRGRKLRGGTGSTRASAFERQRTSAEIKAREASEEPREGSRRRRLSQRQAGRPDREVDGHAVEGESFEEFNPRSAACLKHGGRGFGRNKASGGSKP